MTVLRVNILRGSPTADLTEFLLAANGGPPAAARTDSNCSVSPNDIVLKFETPIHTARGRGNKREDLSAWFNYGFTESTFKSWIAWQLNNRHRLAKSSVDIASDDGSLIKRRRIY